ncbi:MAG: RnfABCDGE type electron transport complex subunit B [Ruminococcaceae bacterium]|nr:RnfABCDGE type electron transport complex subunit B [Oscillospiraceae bacterium]
MDIQSIISAVVVLTSIGAVSAVMLVIVDRFLSIPEDTLVAEITEILPGVNCGACGYAGCQDYALAVTKDEEVNLCVPGGDEVSRLIAATIGKEAKDVVESVAVVRCRGYDGVAKRKMDYDGVKSCIAANAIFGGSRECRDGCLGFGDCVAVCKFDAMQIVDGVAYSDPEKCNGCGVCAETCPKGIIDILPLSNRAVISCSNREKGAIARKQCSNSCIGCGLCEKACNYGAIKVIDNLAQVDSEKCIGCGDCKTVCPTKAICMIFGEQKQLLAD